MVQTTRTGDRYAQASVCRNNCKPLGTPLAEPIYGADLVSRMVTKWNSSRNHPTSFARGRNHRNKKRYGRCFVNPWTVEGKKFATEFLVICLPRFPTHPRNQPNSKTPLHPPPPKFNVECWREVCIFLRARSHRKKKKSADIPPNELTSTLNLKGGAGGENQGKSCPIAV